METRQSLHDVIARDLELLFGQYARYEVRAKCEFFRPLILHGQPSHPIGCVDFTLNEGFKSPSGFVKYFGFLVDVAGQGPSIIVPVELQDLYAAKLDLIGRFPNAGTSLTAFTLGLSKWPSRDVRRDALMTFHPTFSYDEEELVEFLAQFRVVVTRSPAIVDYFASEEFGGLCVELLAKVYVGGRLTSEGLVLCLMDGGWRVIL